MLTPLQINLLLHYYAIAAPFDPQRDDAPAVRTQLTELLMLGLIDPDAGSPSLYRVTDKGRAHVEALCSLPLPECKWTTPPRKQEAA